MWGSDREGTRFGNKVFEKILENDTAWPTPVVVAAAGEVYQSPNTMQGTKTIHTALF